MRWSAQSWTARPSLVPDAELRQTAASVRLTGSNDIAIFQRKLGPFALEAILIVGSILLAFAIDAAWDSREESSREQELLQALKVDFEHNRELLAEARRAHENYRRAAVDFLALSRPGTDIDPSATVPGGVMFGLVSWFTYDPALGSLDSAISSGQIALIESRPLRTALAGWMDSVEDLKELEIVDRGHAHRFTQVAFEYVPFRTLSQPVIPEGDARRPSTAKGDYAGLLVSLMAENVAANRVAEITFILQDIDRVEDELERILDLIDAELD